MKRPSISTEDSFIRKNNMHIESMCNKKKDQLHYHDFVQLWYVLSGTLCHSVNGSEYLQTAGSCVIVLPFTEHAINTLDSEDTPVALSVSFTDDFFTERGTEFFSYSKEYAHFDGCIIPEFSILKGHKKEDANKLARIILSELAPNSKPDFRKLSDLFYEFIKVFCREPVQKKDSPLVIEQARAILHAVRYIAAHSNEKIMREDLCTITAMSRTSFSKAFKEVTGITTKELLLSLRIRKAQALLQYTDDSLNEIAREVGLYDKSHLTHIFCEQLGMSPVQFRNETRPEAIGNDEQFRRRMKYYPKIPKKNNGKNTP